MRTSALASPSGMKSSTRARPVAVTQVVSSTRVSSRYWRLLCSTGSQGARRQRPFSSLPSSAANTAGASKRGRHSQSSEPSRLTRAALRQLPSRA
ncbi:hypothetical protein D3C71_1764980 [compost metagenome]